MDFEDAILAQFNMTVTEAAEKDRRVVSAGYLELQEPRKRIKFTIVAETCVFGTSELISKGVNTSITAALGLNQETKVEAGNELHHIRLRDQRSSEGSDEGTQPRDPTEG